VVVAVNLVVNQMAVLVVVKEKEAQGAEDHQKNLGVLKGSLLANMEEAQEGEVLVNLLPKVIKNENSNVEETN
jgi:hypothetical protein